MTRSEVGAIKKFIESGVKVFEPSGNELHESEVLELYTYLFTYMIKLRRVCMLYPMYHKTFVEFLIIHRFDEDLDNLVYEKFKNTGIGTTNRFVDISELKNGFFICGSFDENSKNVRTFFEEGIIKSYYVILKDVTECTEVVSPLELYDLISNFLHNKLKNRN